MRIRVSKILLVIMITNLLSSPFAYAQTSPITRQDSFEQRYDTFFTVLEETFDASDYSETFRQSFFNFQTNYSANNCNYAQRMEILKKKDAILDDLIDNINSYSVDDAKTRLSVFKNLDLELTVLRNLDLLELVPLNDPNYSRDPMYLAAFDIHRQDFNGNYTEIKAEVDLILDKYEENFNQKIIDPQGNVTTTGVYSECSNRFNRTYQAWSQTLDKFGKGNSQQIVALNKALKEFIKSITSFSENFQNNLKKVFKEELAFLERNSNKEDGFFKNLWNVTKGSAAAVGGDFVKVGQAFSKEYNRLKTNLTAGSDENLKKYILSKRSLTSDQNAFRDALQSGLNLNQIAQSVESLKQQSESVANLEIEFKKLQILTDIHSAYALQIQATSSIPSNYIQDCIQAVKGTSQQRSLDKIFEHVYTNQCK